MNPYLPYMGEQEEEGKEVGLAELGMAYPTLEPFSPMKPSATPTKSSSMGKTNKNAIPFDDFLTTAQYCASARVHELRILHDKDAVLGVEAIYKAGEETASGGLHAEKAVSLGVKFESICLTPDEKITSITCFSGDAINGMSIKTSSGKNYKFGDLSKGKSSKVDIPDGKTLVAILGSVSNRLHTLGCYYV